MGDGTCLKGARQLVWDVIWESFMNRSFVLYDSTVPPLQLDPGCSVGVSVGVSHILSNDGFIDRAPVTVECGLRPVAPGTAQVRVVGAGGNDLYRDIGLQARAWVAANAHSFTRRTELKVGGSWRNGRKDMPMVVKDKDRRLEMPLCG